MDVERTLKINKSYCNSKRLIWKTRFESYSGCVRKYKIGKPSWNRNKIPYLKHKICVRWARYWKQKSVWLRLSWRKLWITFKQEELGDVKLTMNSQPSSEVTPIQKLPIPSIEIQHSTPACQPRLNVFCLRGSPSSIYILQNVIFRA